VGIVDFGIIVLVCCIIAAGVNFGLAKLAPNTPAFVPYLIWAVACLIIIVSLAQALGLSNVNPRIPSLK